MKTEFEIKFINLQIDEIHQKLSTLEAEIQSPRKLYKRQTFGFSENIPGVKRFIRVRDQGKIIITYKYIPNTETIDGTQESELEVVNFDQAVDFLKSLGYIPMSYQENFREVWMVGNVEVTIDEWPLLLPFIEIEGKSKNEVLEVVDKLKLNFDNGMFASVDLVYQKTYGITQEKFNKIPKITFSSTKEILGI